MLKPPAKSSFGYVHGETQKPVSHC